MPRKLPSPENWPSGPNRLFPNPPLNTTLAPSSLRQAMSKYQERKQKQHTKLKNKRAQLSKQLHEKRNKLLMKLQRHKKKIQCGQKWSQIQKRHKARCALAGKGDEAAEGAVAMLQLSLSTNTKKCSIPALGEAPALLTHQPRSMPNPTLSRRCDGTSIGSLPRSGPQESCVISLSSSG